MSKSLIISIVTLTLGSMSTGVGIILMALLVPNGVFVLLTGIVLVTFGFIFHALT